MKYKISVVITTKNEEKTLPVLLKSLKSQSLKDFEIVVVDNNSSDNTAKIAKKFGCQVFNKGPERSVQRNFGVKKARGETVLILDADMKLSPNVLTECYKQYKRGYKALVVPEKSYGTGIWVKFKIFEREFYEGEQAYEAARFFDRKTFLEFGGYNTKITGPEDYELPLRMRKNGITIGRIKSYIYHNEKNFSPLKSARKKFYYAKGSREYLKKHPEMLVFVPSLYKLAVVTNLS